MKTFNRYNDTVYVKYTHCEFHPCMMLGTSSACIPFADHNQAPRNIYNFSQRRQAAGIYAESFSQDPEFYEFTRSMKAYVETFESKSDVMLIDSESEFFKYLNDKKDEN